MDCYNNQKRPDYRRPAMPVPLDNYGYNAMPYTVPQALQPRRMEPAAPCGSAPNSCQGSASCPGSVIGAIEGCPIGIGYVPWQQWKQTYPIDRGLHRGTIFPELDLPFRRGRCQ